MLHRPQKLSTTSSKLINVLLIIALILLATFPSCSAFSISGDGGKICSIASVTRTQHYNRYCSPKSSNNRANTAHRSTPGHTFTQLFHDANPSDDVSYNAAVPKSSLSCSSTSTTAANANAAQKLKWMLEVNPQQFIRRIISILRASTVGASYAVRTSWWCFPLILTLIPPYCFLVLDKAPRMPDWWPVLFCFDDMHPVYIALFLLSNVAYYISSVVLLRDRRHPQLLALFTFLAALASTFYHLFQSMGMRIVAETLSYIDHGVAIAAGMYFLHKCGLPRLGTTILGFSGLSFLAFYGDFYAPLHSIWHVCSAGAIVSWANDRLVRRQRYIGRELASKRRARLSK